ncbi:MAG TPA: SGNH/GDSL hydrolase family protein [Jatrophihabitans sp.]
MIPPRALAAVAIALTTLPFLVSAATADAGAPRSAQIDTWAASADDLGGPYVDKTVRDIVHTSVAGSAVRLRLSNAFGTRPVTFDSVWVGRQAAGAAVVAGSNHEATFGGSPSVTIPRGGEVLSDPVNLDVPAGVNLSVSTHVAGDTGEVTGHHLAQQDNYYADGNTADQASAGSYVYGIGSWFWLDAVVVDAAPRAGTVVTLGDSITDGYRSTPDANHRWPDYLARRLAARNSPLSVANEGISGNEVTADGAGVSAEARFDRDVASQPGASTVIFVEGINDIGNGVVTSADQLIAADKQIIARAHASGLRILGGTLTPFQGAGYYSDQKEAIREAVNSWIRSSGAFDGVVDFDRAVRDRANPHAFLPAYDCGDHLHPDDAGYAAMADAVPLSALR